MKIAFVIPRFDPKVGGVEGYAVGLAAGLAKRGEDITVFTSAPHIPGASPPGLRVEPVPVAGGSRSASHRRFDAAVRGILGDSRAWDVVQGFGLTTVHTVHRAGGGSHPAYLRAMSCAWSPWKAGWERLRPKSRKRIETERAIFRAPDLYGFANSEKTRREVCLDYGADAKRISVIHNGVDLETFHPSRREERHHQARRDFGLASGEFAIAFVGSGFARKGLGFALESVSRMRRAGVSAVLLVAGRGATRPYARLAHARGISDGVRFLGPVGDVQAVYAAADAFLLPSRYEPFGIAALEAMACGLPVVVTRDCGVAEVLEDGREGRLLPRPEAVDDAAGFLTELARDPRERERFGSRARASAERLDQERHVERVLDVYRALLSKQRAKAK